jgi:hypothetical protein
VRLGAGTGPGVVAHELEPGEDDDGDQADNEKKAHAGPVPAARSRQPETEESQTLKIPECSYDAATTTLSVDIPKQVPDSS